MKYMARALFIYDEQSFDLVETVKNNDFGTEIIALEQSAFLNDPLEYLIMTNHLVLAGSMATIHQLLEYAYSHSASGRQCTLGFLPLSSQKVLRQAYHLPTSLADNLEIALREEPKAINLLECNGQLFQFKAIIGNIPLLEGWHSDTSPGAFLKNIWLGIKQFYRLSMNQIVIETERGKQLKSVASGGFIVNQIRENRLLKNLHYKNSMRSDRLSLMLISPYSVMEYFLFLLSLIFQNKKDSRLPHAVSEIQSTQVSLDFETRGDEVPEVKLDDLNSTSFPLHFRVIKQAIKINASEEFWEFNPVSTSDKEVIRTDNLPDEKEMAKYLHKHLPFFSVASEERFKDLFLQLRSDARINSLYVSLMLLSTLLATFGLFANSAAVVIGAMLIAPLMAPIISNSMGLLRGDENLVRQSMAKIILGFMLALIASCLLTLFVPQVDLTNEIRARIHPNLLDLGIAIISGVAAAYTKSHKELLNNLAGVAIAVALVPPLATAGIGLGRGDFYVLEGALLLFVTNLIGIIVAATITFQFLGFSNAVKSKKHLFFIFSILAVLSYPLYRSYTDSLERYQLTRSLLDEQIVINQKPILIETASVEYQQNMRIINITIVLKQLLNSEALQLLKEKIDQRISRKHETRVSIKRVL